MKSRTTLILAVLALTSIESAVAQTPPKAEAGSRLAEQFRKADANGDGRLSREEGRMLPNFDAIDADHDGLLTPQEVGNFYTPKKTLDAPTAVGESSGARPDFSGEWVLHQEAGTAKSAARPPASKVTYVVTQDEQSVSFQLSGSPHAIRFPLDGSESLITLPTGRRARLSGRWLPDGRSLELKTVVLSNDGMTPFSTYTEQHTLAADGRSITERRIFEEAKGKRTDTRVFVRAQGAKTAPVRDPSLPAKTTSPAATERPPVSTGLSATRPATAPFDPKRELGLGEALPEEPERPLRRYLYLAMRDSSILPPLAIGSGDPHGIIVLDMDHGMKFVKRIGSEVLLRGRTTVSSGPGVRWMHGSAVTDRLYYGYSEPGAVYLRGIHPASPPPPDANALIGCIDLRTDETLWEQPTHNACSFAVFPDGSKLLAVPDQSQAAHGRMTVLDAMSGRVLEEIPSQSRVAYGVNVVHDGRYLLPNAWGGTLTAFDTQTGREEPLAAVFPRLASMDSSGVSERFRQFYSLDVATHFSVNGAGDFLWSQVRNSIRRSGGGPNVDGGLVFFDLREGRSALVPLHAPLLENAVEPGRSRWHRWNAWDDHSVNLFGIGYVAALSLDERWLYHGTYAGDFKVIVWDRSTWPPRMVGVMGEGLSSQEETDPVSGGQVGSRNKSGAWVSADGRQIFTSDSWVFDARTWKPVGLMRNDQGQIIRCAKLNEVHFRGQDCVYFGQRFGFGRYRDPTQVFPLPADKTPPGAVTGPTAKVLPPEARISGGEVVVCVELQWQPATDKEGVQRYAVYRDGELIGNCLGQNPDDPVLSNADAAVFREQVGEFKEHSFAARYLKPGRRYRFEIEPIDFAQNRGRRVSLDVSTPPVDGATEDAIVKAWAERILSRANESPGSEQSQQCREALAHWIERQHHTRPWAADLLRRTRLPPIGDSR